MLGLTTCASLCLLALAGGRPPVIATGWDSPGPRHFREGLAEFEKWGLFDGTSLGATRSLPDGKRIPALHAFSAEHWEWSEFEEGLEDLEAASPTTCTENYLMCSSNPGNVDWFDDAGWQEIADHWRLLARLAKRGGLRGLLFDPEPYTRPASQYLYRAQASREEHSFAEYRAQARKRGGQVMRAVRAEFPEVTILSYRLFSDLLGLLDSGDLERALEPETYGLLPSFVDGWLDEAPDGLRIIEGTEAIGYRANSPAEYDGAFARLRLRFADFLAPEHRAGTDKWLRIGQSLYLDAYAVPADSPAHIDHTGTTAAARLAANLQSALAASDGVVWVYGERGRWWGHSGRPAWPSLIDGLLDAIGRARDPDGYAARLWARKPSPANLLPNVGFARSARGAGAPDNWRVWQEDGSEGRVTTDDGVVTLSGFAHGTVAVTVPVQPGRTYAFRVQARSEGAGLAFVYVTWEDGQRHWVARERYRRLVGPEVPGRDGWRELAALIEAPPSAAKLTLQLSATGQFGAGDRCQFREPGLTEAE